MFEKWWYYGPLPQAWGSRLCLKVERAREVGVSLLWSPKEERGWTQMTSRGPDGEYKTTLIQNTLLFELTAHLLMWRLTFFCVHCAERP